MDETERSEFGRLFHLYRARSKDLETGVPVTQERFAELLEVKANLPGYSYVRVSRWEKGGEKGEVIRHDNRKLLVGILHVLYLCKGLTTLEEADTLLRAGGYRNLDDVEIKQINSAWEANRSQTDPIDQTQRFPDNQEPQQTTFRSVLARSISRIRQALTQAPQWGNPSSVRLHPSTCGDDNINLGNQRLVISSAFGAYFTGLLERQHNYLEIPAQILTPIPKGQEGLTPIERIFWALQYARGPRLLIVAAEGGMGKSTLAAKIIRCLLHEQTVDMVLGDSAKNHLVNLTTGAIVPIEPGYYNITSFYQRVSSQLGLPFKYEQTTEKQILTNIQDRLTGRRAVVMVDNLETVAQGDELLRTLKLILGRDVRAIVTTRSIHQLQSLSADTMVIHLLPLTDITNAQQFLAWHIQHYHEEHPALQMMMADIQNHKRVQRLIKRTGGIPLLMQLILSDITRYSWDYLDQLPQLFGTELLNFLYQSRWNELKTIQNGGVTAQNLLRWVADEQYRGRKVSLEKLKRWAHEQAQIAFLTTALKLLHERFLILNNDPIQGNFAIFPSLTEFIQQQT